MLVWATEPQFFFLCNKDYRIHLYEFYQVELREYKNEEQGLACGRYNKHSSPSPLKRQWAESVMNSDVHMGSWRNCSKQMLLTHGASRE